MDREQEINKNISYYRNRIYDCKDDIASMQKEVDNLEKLYDKLLQLTANFHTRQEGRVTSVTKIGNLTFNTNITDKYYSGMHGLLTGSEYSIVIDGLDRAKNIIREKIFELEEQINQKRTQIYNYQHKIDRLYIELHSLQSK